MFLNHNFKHFVVFMYKLSNNISSGGKELCGCFCWTLVDY